MNVLPRLMNRYGAYAVLVFIVTAAFVLRFAAYDHPIGLQGGEGFRDYLTARHILQFNEFPAAGPWNQTLPHVGNSPLYYYLLAIPLLFSQSWHALEIAYIGLSCVMIVLVFLLVREIFGTRAALLCASIYAFAPQMIMESARFVWQPYVMEPILIGSCLLAVIGYTRKRLDLTLGSIALFICALSLHLSVLGVLPIFALFVGYVLYGSGKLRGIVYGALTACGAFFLIFLLPRMLATPIFAGTPTPAPERGHFGRLLELLLLRVTPLEDPAISTGLFIGIGVLIACATALYVYGTRAAFPKLAMLTAAAVVIVQCASAAGYGTQVDTRFVLPATFSLVVMLGVPAAFVLSLFPFSRISTVLVIAGFAALSISTPFVATGLRKPVWSVRPYDMLASRAADSLAADLRLIRENEGYADYSFFSLLGYRTRGHNFVPDMMWSALEDRFDTQLVHLSGDSGGLTGPHGTPYIALLCADGDRSIFHYTVHDCLLNVPEGYVVLKPELLDPSLNVFLLQQRTAQDTYLTD